MAAAQPASSTTRACGEGVAAAMSSPCAIVRACVAEQATACCDRARRAAARRGPVHRSAAGHPRRRLRAAVSRQAPSAADACARQLSVRHGRDAGRPTALPYNRPRRASPHGSAANRVRSGTEQPQPLRPVPGSGSSPDIASVPSRHGKPARRGSAAVSLSAAAVASARGAASGPAGIAGRSCLHAVPLPGDSVRRCSRAGDGIVAAACRCSGLADFGPGPAGGTGDQRTGNPAHIGFDELAPERSPVADRAPSRIPGLRPCGDRPACRPGGPVPVRGLDHGLRAASDRRLQVPAASATPRNRTATATGTAEAAILRLPPPPRSSHDAAR